MSEKVYELFKPHEKHTVAAEETGDAEAILAREKEKIKAAVRTDFILSIEIIVIALGTVMEQTLPIQVMVVSLIAVLATIGVYGLVALLVRMDDTGIYLIARSKNMQGFGARAVHGTGTVLIAALPKVIRLLGYVGTVAMLLVGGGMFVHNIEWVHQALHFLPAVAAELLAGLVVGGIILAGMKAVGKH